MMSLTLPSGETVLYDDEDADLVAAHRWRAVPGRHTTYVGTSSSTKYLHRMIMNPPPRMVVHHRNGNGLDNRRANLHVDSQSVNIGAKRGRPNKSGYRGVYPTPAGNWVAEIKVGYQKRRLGTFTDKWAAAQAYNAAATEAWGEFAQLNVKEEPNASDGIGCPGTVNA
jgi:hypothetical protein